VQNAKNGFSRNYFTEEKSVDHVRPRSTVDRPWTAAPSSSELRPLAVSVSKGTDHWVGEEE
jgi:hypothetical protein